MKVNEVINEAWSDYLPKFVPARELEAQKKRRKQQAYVYRQSARFGDQAYKELERILTQQNVKLSDPRTYNSLQGYTLGDFLKAFALKFFGSDPTTGKIVQNEVNKIPVPAQLTPGSIKQYLNAANEGFREVLKNSLGVQMRQDAEAAKAQELAAQQNDQPEPAQAEPEQTAPAAQTAPALAQGVSVLSQEPMVLQVGKKRYYVMDDGLWHEQGNRNPVDPSWNEFLTQQADLATPESPVRTVERPAPARPAPVAPRPVQQQPARQAVAQASPEEIRQRKQADAIEKARQQLQQKPRIKVRPGETTTQAMSRSRNNRT